MRQLGNIKVSHSSPSFPQRIPPLQPFKRSKRHDLTVFISFDNDFPFRRRESGISIKPKQSANIILQAVYKKFIILLKAKQVGAPAE